MSLHVLCHTVTLSRQHPKAAKLQDLPQGAEEERRARAAMKEPRGGATRVELKDDWGNLGYG